MARNSYDNKKSCFVSSCVLVVHKLYEVSTATLGKMNIDILEPDKHFVRVIDK